ncbi:Uu.00g108920.m01.CDS01 [Anthostomella pinea]|uniref:Uu.00g108920.m01.CDS01 n=1 Tax=Anthostomella pinea TaxID=933095 RepID=A0AAI8VEN0_9PEZI|nr:Uu.00g108920.m01.CDS01 [Anthostomella pinea]
MASIPLRNPFTKAPASRGYVGEQEDNIAQDTSAVPLEATATESSTKPMIDAQDSHVVRDDGKVIITEQEYPEALGFYYSTLKKWRILTVIFLVQTSMNLNTSLYANGQAGIARQFEVSPQTTVSGAAIFLITYAFGCELWAPWSEEFGRKPILQASLFLVNICCLPVALAPRGISSILVGRAFGGLFSAGGSVTLGMVADMFTTDQQELPLAYIVLSSVGGSIVGPIVGGFVETDLPWQWTIWIQLIVSAFVQMLHFFFVPETRSSVLLDAHAKKLRASNQRPNAYGPNELKSWKEYIALKEMLSIWGRPFKMFVMEPIVSVLSALSGFSDALIFMQIQSFGLVFGNWGFTKIQTGLAFLPIGLAYVLAYLLFIPIFRRNRRLRQAHPLSEHAQYESRMWCLLYMAPCLPIGLLIFAWTSTPLVHWIAPMIGCVFIGIANYAIYMATIDYMVAAYGPYSASATGGNGFARDFLAGCLTWLAAPYYHSFQMHNGLQIANTVLAAISLLLVAATFVIYWKGPSMRRRSPFAQSISRTTVDGLVSAQSREPLVSR